jgi:hypothetical protein
VDRIAPEVTRLQGEVFRVQNVASNVQSAMDGYSGLPTVAQLQQLDWAWEDAIAGVTALNRVIQQELPGLYAALDATTRMPEIKPVPLPAR